MSLRMSSPEGRCGLRERDEPLDCGLRDCGERRESLLECSRASRAFFMRSSKALRQSLPEERCGVRERDEPLDGELFDCELRDREEELPDLEEPFD